MENLKKKKKKKKYIPTMDGTFTHKKYLYRP